MGQEEKRKTTLQTLIKTCQWTASDIDAWGVVENSDREGRKACCESGKVNTWMKS
jgi:hypothetical protein